MSPVKTKEELTRLAWITELRRQGHRQCAGLLFDDYQGRNHVCALGLLAEVAGYSGNSMYPIGHVAIGAFAGLKVKQTADVYEANDNGYTFAEIADLVEGWFK